MSEEKKRKVLVVEDEPDNAYIFIDPLLALSFFEKSKRRKYDLLILNIKMPDMNGFELYEQIKKIDSKVKVCFLTAFGEGYTEELKRGFHHPQLVSDLLEN